MLHFPPMGSKATCVILSGKIGGRNQGSQFFHFHLFENSINSRDINTGQNVSASKFQKLNFITINLLKYCQHLDFLKTNVLKKFFLLIWAYLCLIKSLLMKVKGEWKSWLKAQHSENEDHGIWSHHFMGNRWGNNGNSVRLYFSGLQNHCRWWLQPWN